MYPEQGSRSKEAFLGGHLKACGRERIETIRNNMDKYTSEYARKKVTYRNALERTQKIMQDIAGFCELSPVTYRNETKRTKTIQVTH